MAAILATPALYDQRQFADSEDPCGSPCCIAGWLIWMEDPSLFVKLAHEEGEFIGESERIISCHSDGLFGTGAAWPEPFATQLYNARTPKQKALAAAGAIDNFIESRTS